MESGMSTWDEDDGITGAPPDRAPEEKVMLSREVAKCAYTPTGRIGQLTYALGRSDSAGGVPSGDAPDRPPFLCASSMNAGTLPTTCEGNTFCSGRMFEMDVLEGQPEAGGFRKRAIRIHGSRDIDMPGSVEETNLDAERYVLS